MCYICACSQTIVAMETQQYVPLVLLHYIGKVTINITR